MNVGFIGLGRMGCVMARNVFKAGHRVLAWNRSPDAVRAVPGAERATTPGEVFTNTEVVLTMLADDPAVRSVILDSGALANASTGTVHVVTATISVDFAAELTRRHDAAGVAYVSAPVFGRPDVAEAAQLGIVAAGKAGAIAKAQPVFDAIGRKTWVLGDEPRQANAAKIAGNMMIAMAIEAMAEAAALVESHGVTPAAFFDLVLGTQFGGRAYDGYSAKIVKEDYEAGFTMRLGLKDVGLAIGAAKAAPRPLPMLNALHGRMTEAVTSGFGEKDWSAIAAYARGRSG